MTVYRATVRQPGKNRIVGPDKESPADALEWARGYCRPAPFPAGTTVHVDGAGAWLPVPDARTGTIVLRKLGRTDK